jgi:hypothetical protein
MCWRWTLGAIAIRRRNSLRANTGKLALLLRMTACGLPDRFRPQDDWLQLAQRYGYVSAVRSHVLKGSGIWQS